MKSDSGAENFKLNLDNFENSLRDYFDNKGQNKSSNKKQIGGEIVKKLEVPYSSQTTGSVPANWRDSACGIACVKMLIDFLSRENPTMGQLLQEGLLIDGHRDGGWLHEALIRMLRNHGVLAYRQEFRAATVDLGAQEMFVDESPYSSKFIDEGMVKIIRHIDLELPVIASVSSGFGNNKSPHMVVISGYKFRDANTENEGFYVHDPDDRDTERREHQFISFQKFAKFWRMFCIFPEQV